MILFHKKYKIDINNLVFKKKRTFSDKFTFIPIMYDKKDLIIQTPLLFIPFTIRKYSTNSSNQYLDLSFQNQENDDDFLTFLNQIYKAVYKKYSNEYQVESFIKDSECLQNRHGSLLEDSRNFSERMNSKKTQREEKFSIPRENFRDQDEFNVTFDNKKKNGEFSDKIIKYENDKIVAYEHHKKGLKYIQNATGLIRFSEEGFKII